MDGLRNHSADNHIINKWYQLFKEQNNIHSDLKYKSWKNVKKCGLPHKKDEKWKYTPLDDLFSHTFINPTLMHNITESDRDILSLNINSYRLVFINGFFSKKLSTKNLGPWKIKILNRNTHLILPQPIQSEIFSYLAECLSQETIHIALPHHKISKIPLYLLHINQGTNNKSILTTIHYRHHIEICNDSSGQIIEHHASINENSHFNNSRMSIIMGANTQIKHTKLSFENRKSFHISYNDIYANFNSTIESNIFNIFGSHLNYQQTNALLNDKLSSLSLNSLSLPVEKDISNIVTYVEHNQPGHNLSKQIHKIIAANHGQGIFHGTIKVNKQATQIDGKMINKNLLLHSSSKIFSMPQLEIYADDVICNHGATMGCVDHRQIFYLCSRGIPYSESYQMVIYAFSHEIIEIINDNYIQNDISNRIQNILIRTCNDISYRKNSI